MANLNRNTGGGGNPFSDASALVKNSSDASKLLKVSAASISTGTTRTLTAPNVDGTIAVEPVTVVHKFSDPTPSNHVSSEVMMGLAQSFTPASRTGKALVLISGSIQNDTGGNGGTVRICWGSGSAPSNGASQTGSTSADPVEFYNGSDSIEVPFCVVALMSGLSAGTTYWVDLAVNVLGAGNVAVKTPNVVIFEL